MSGHEKVKKLLTKSDRHDKISKLPQASNERTKKKNKKVVDNDLKT